MMLKTTDTVHRVRKIRKTISWGLITLVASLATSPAWAASYQLIGGGVVDPIQATFCGPHYYAGPNLEPAVDLSFFFEDLSYAVLTNADLSGQDLSGLDLSGVRFVDTDLTGAEYDELTIFPSGFDYTVSPWGLAGGASPWELGMTPVPEPSMPLMLLFGAAGLAFARRAGRGSPQEA